MRPPIGQSIAGLNDNSAALFSGVRGEISEAAQLSTIARVIPEMAAYRSLSQRKPFDAAFLTALVDDVILPALNVSAP